MIFCSGAFCQNDESPKTDGTSTLLGVSVGINDFHQRDEYLSPSTFNGVNFASKLSFQVETEMNRHRVDAFFSTGALNPDIQGREVTEKGGYLSYSFVHSLNRWDLGGHPFRFSLGGGISSFVMNTDFNTTDETGYTKLDQSWYWSHSLNLVLLGEYHFDRDKNLTLQLTAPLVGLVSRPENGHRLSQNNLDVVDENFLKAATQGKMEYLWSNFVLFTDVEYRQSLSNGFDLLVAYRFGYVSSNKPASMLSMGTYMNSLSVGILWSIG
jgi:hypothetical protein